MSVLLSIPKLLFGNGAVRALRDQLADLGARKPLLVTDRGLVACGVFARVLDTLGGSSAESMRAVFADVPENPTYEGVDRAAALYRASGCDAVVAVGGGSVIDTAKLVAVLAGHPGAAQDYVGHSDRITRSTAALVAIPTTAGTGSEASPDAGLHPSANAPSSGVTSAYIVPRVAICDPELTLTLPPRLTAATALDALSHCIEGYLSSTNSPLVDTLALDGIGRAWAHMTAATDDGRDLAARGQLMLAAFAGGLAISKGLGPAHAIAIAAGDQGLHHGLLSGLGLVATAPLLQHKVPVRYADIACALGLAPDGEVASALRQMMLRLSLPASLEQMGYRLGSLPRLAGAAAASHFNLTSRYRPSAAEYAQMILEILR